MLLRSARGLSVLLLVALLTSWLPFAPIATAAPSGMLTTSQPASVAPVDDPPPPPDVRTLPTVTYPQLPGLALELAIAPDPLAVGDTGTIGARDFGRGDLWSAGSAAEHPL
jgi:hypothetical protein